MNKQKNSQMEICEKKMKTFLIFAYVEENLRI